MGRRASQNITAGDVAAKRGRARGPDGGREGKDKEENKKQIASRPPLGYPSIHPRHPGPGEEGKDGDDRLCSCTAVSPPS